MRPVYKHGNQVRSTHMSLKYLHNRKRQSYRAAIVVSKKVSKSAVVRNRIRRRLYEAIRAEQDQIKKPYDIVITIYNETVAQMPFIDLQKTVNQLLKKAKII